MDILNTELKRQAVDFGLCRKWTKMWSASYTQSELIEKFKEGMDFCIEHDFPSVEFIRENFTPAVLEQNGVFVNADVDFTDNPLPSGIYVIMGDTKGTFRFKPWSAVTLFVRHDSDITVRADDFAQVFVRLYDNSEVDTICTESGGISIRDRRN